MSEGPKSGSRAAGLTIASGIVDRDGDRRVTSKDVDHLHARGVAPRFGIDKALFGDSLQRAVLSRPIVLPMVIERPAVPVIEVHRPKVDEVEAALHRALLERFELPRGHLSERGDKAPELDVHYALALQCTENRLGLECGNL